MTLLERIREHNRKTAELRKELENIKSYYAVPYEEMYEYYHLMPQRSAEKFVEGWIANLIGGQKMEDANVPEDLRKDDNGDIWIGNELTIGKNNIEVKVVFREAANIGGKQFRFYEDVPYYLIFKAWDAARYEIFLLSKEELVAEIQHRAETTTRSAFISSQGSGVISRMTQAQKVTHLLECVDKQHDTKITWEFNSKTEPELYKHWQAHYLVDPQDIRTRILG